MKFVMLAVAAAVALNPASGADEPPIRAYTMVCADWYGPAVCREYPGHLTTKENGCTHIGIVGREAEICGDYTIERFERQTP